MGFSGTGLYAEKLKKESVICESYNIFIRNGAYYDPQSIQIKINDKTDSFGQASVFKIS